MSDFNSEDAHILTKEAKINKIEHEYYHIILTIKASCLL